MQSDTSLGFEELRLGAGELGDHGQAGAVSERHGAAGQAPAPALLDLPEPVLTEVLGQLPLASLLMASSACSRLYDAALPLYAAHLPRLGAAPPPRTAGAPPGHSTEGSAQPTTAGRAAQRAQRAACARHLRSACTHCGEVPKGHRIKEHPTNPRLRLCRRCAKLECYKMITLENAMEKYGLLKTDLRPLACWRESRKVPGKGFAPKWRTYVWYCLQDVEARVEELFGEGWRDRADFLSHEA